MPQVWKGSPRPGRPTGGGGTRADRLTQTAMDLLAFYGVRPFAAHRPRHARAANARLVAMTGLALLVLLPVPYVTALNLDVLWRVHYFSALLLIPLLVLKLAGTGWRAVRYYLGDRGFREDGPPHPMPRITAPILVLSTVVLFLSGVEMLLGANRFGPWSTIHNGAAIIFTGALGLHLLAHLWDTPAEVAADVAPSRVATPVRVLGSRRRVVVTTVAFVVGITLATAAMPVSQWQGSRPAGQHHRDG
jgi:hypothetical protein